VRKRASHEERKFKNCANWSKNLVVFYLLILLRVRFTYNTYVLFFNFPLKILLCEFFHMGWKFIF